MRKLVITLKMILFAATIYAQVDTIKVPIIIDEIRENGEYVSTTKGVLQDGSHIIVKVFLKVNVPRDTVFLKPKNYKEF